MDPVSVIISALSGAVGAVANAVGASKVKQTAQVNQRTEFGAQVGNLRSGAAQQDTYTRLALIIAGTLIVIFILRFKK